MKNAKPGSNLQFPRRLVLVPLEKARQPARPELPFRDPRRLLARFPIGLVCFLSAAAILLWLMYN